MRKFLGFVFVLLALLMLASVPTMAQTTGSHTVTLSWTPSVDGGVVNVYRATGVCSSTLTFTAISTGVTGTAYIDSGIAPGKFCYQVTTVVNGAESLPSNPAQAVILPAPPSNLTLTVK